MCKNNFGQNTEIFYEYTHHLYFLHYILYQYLISKSTDKYLHL